MATASTGLNELAQSVGSRGATPSPSSSTTANAVAQNSQSGFSTMLAGTQPQLAQNSVNTQKDKNQSVALEKTTTSSSDAKAGAQATQSNSADTQSSGSGNNPPNTVAVTAQNQNNAGVQKTVSSGASSSNANSKDASSQSTSDSAQSDVNPQALIVAAMQVIPLVNATNDAQAKTDTLVQDKTSSDNQSSVSEATTAVDPSIAALAAASQAVLPQTVSTQSAQQVSDATVQGVMTSKDGKINAQVLAQLWNPIDQNKTTGLTTQQLLLTGRSDNAVVQGDVNNDQASQGQGDAKAKATLIDTVSAQQNADQVQASLKAAQAAQTLQPQQATQVTQSPSLVSVNSSASTKPVAASDVVTSQNDVAAADTAALSVQPLVLAPALQIQSLRFAQQGGPKNENVKTKDTTSSSDANALNPVGDIAKTNALQLTNVVINSATLTSDQDSDDVSQDKGRQSSSALSMQSTVTQTNVSSGQNEATSGVVATKATAPYSFASQLSAQHSLSMASAVDQVALQINRNAKNGSNQMTLQMHPADLGQVNVKLDISSDGKVSGFVTASNSTTLDMLSKDSRSLERSLQDAGFQADPGSLQFSMSDQSGSRSNQNAAQSSSNSGFGGASDIALNDGMSLPVVTENYYVTSTGVNLRV